MPISYHNDLWFIPGFLLSPRIVMKADLFRYIHLSDQMHFIQGEITGKDMVVCFNFSFDLQFSDLHLSLASRVSVSGSSSCV